MRTSIAGAATSAAARSASTCRSTSSSRIRSSARSSIWPRTSRRANGCEAQAREGARGAIPERRRARLAARAGAARRLAGAVPRQRPRYRPRLRRSRCAARRRPWRPTPTRGRSTSTGWSPRARSGIAVDQDEARLLGLSSEAVAGALNAAITGATVTQVRDDIYLIDVVARATERGTRSTSRRWTRCRCRSPDGRHGRAQPVRDLRVRPGVPAGLAPRPRPDPDRAGGRRARDPAEAVVDALEPRHRRAECEAAAVLRDRARRHRGGEREVARVGVRGGAAHALPHGDLPDGPAAQLPASLPRAERRSAGPDRRGRGAAAVRPAARLRGDPRHPGAASA